MGQNIYGDTEEFKAEAKKFFDDAKECRAESILIIKREKGVATICQCSPMFMIEAARALSKEVKENIDRLLSQGI